MNQTITSREELLLAKIAGHDVDLKTMTPGVASNLSEQFMLEIADRLDHMGGETYETVAEIQVGEMTEEEGLYVSRSKTPFADNLQSGDTLFLEVGTEKYPLEIIRDDEEGFLMALWYNWSADEGATGIPAFYLEYESDSGVFESLVSTEDLSNTTVRILKKASGPSGGGKFVVTLTEDTSGGELVYTADKTVAECIEAYNDGKIVVCQYPVHEGGAIDTYPELCMSEENVIVFGNTAVIVEEHSISNITIYGMVNDGSDKWEVAIVTVGRIPDNYKPTYTFGFTVTADVEHPGQYICTPNSPGVTYSAITSAIAETENVYAVASIDNTVIRLRFTTSSSTNGYVAADGIINMNGGAVWAAVRIEATSSGNFGVLLNQITVIN